jgi:ribose 5-phosphate isomerase RpiB
MRITIGSDHAGFDLKEVLLEHLRQSDHQVIDLGTKSTAPADCPIFLNARFTAEERHQRRRAKTLSIEQRYATEAAAREQEP